MRSIKPRTQSGFTLIELMTVVAITSILTVIALPAYQDYLIKAKIGEGVLATSQCRTTVAEVYQLAPPTTTVSANGWGCGEGLTQTQYVTSVATDVDGWITVTLRGIDPAVDGSTISLIPLDQGGADATVATDMGSQLSGFECRTGWAGNSIDDKYLPSSCR